MQLLYLNTVVEVVFSHRKLVTRIYHRKKLKSEFSHSVSGYIRMTPYGFQPIFHHTATPVSALPSVAYHQLLHPWNCTSWLYISASHLLKNISGRKSSKVADTWCYRIKTVERKADLEKVQVILFSREKKIFETIFFGKQRNLGIDLFSVV